MASILVGITFHFVPARLIYLREVVRELARFPVPRLDIVVLTNTVSPADRGSINDILDPLLTDEKRLEVMSCPGLAHPFDLAWCHKQLITERVLPKGSQYSHFIYLEDDIRFDYFNLCYFIEYRQKLAPWRLIPSFVRTEFNLSDGQLYATDFLRPFTPSSGLALVIGRYRFCCTDFPYCGMFILDRELTEEYVLSPSFSKDRSVTLTEWGVRERAAMGLCWEHPPSGFRSRHVIPVNLDLGVISSSCWVAHLHGRYANDQFQPYGKIPMRRLVRMTQDDDRCTSQNALLQSNN